MSKNISCHYSHNMINMKYNISTTAMNFQNPRANKLMDKIKDENVASLAKLDLAYRDKRV